MQTWRGPYQLRMDRVTGFTTDKGFNFQPHEYEVNRVGTWDLRRVNISGGNYLLWKNDWSLLPTGPAGYWEQRQTDFWVQPGRSWGWAYPTPEHWGALQMGTPPGGDFVPVGVAGLGYVQQGYAQP